MAVTEGFSNENCFLIFKLLVSIFSSELAESICYSYLLGDLDCSVKALNLCYLEDPLVFLQFLKEVISL